MPESVCGPRLRTLGDQVAELRTRREELLCGTEAVEIGPPTDEELEGIRAGLRKTVTQGPPAELKALMQKFVEEIRVESRSSIHPVFRLPAGEQVRAVYRSVRPAGFEPATRCLEGSRSVP